MPRNECEDMAQEAWLRALEHSDQFPGEHTLAEVFSWLATIVYHAAVDALRKRNGHPIQALEDAALELVDRTEAARTQMAEVIEQLTPLLARLQREAPANYQLVCKCYLEEKKVGEVAGETGLTAHKISYRLHRTLRKMRSYAP